MVKDGLIAQIDTNLFFELIGGTLQEIFKKNEKAHDRFMVKKDEEVEKVNQYDHLKLDQMISIRKLGQG